MTKACQGAPSVGILVFDDVEVLDFAGPYEVLGQATRDDGAPACRVLALAPALDVRCRGGLRVRADATLDDAPPLDLLIVPGGPGTRAEGAALERLVQYVRGCARCGTTIASVCTGAFVLARAGVLDGRAATTHHDWLDRLGAGFPAVRVTGGKVVDEGAVLTAGGISSGIDLALHILERWFGPGVRSRAAERLEGAWR